MMLKKAEVKTPMLPSEEVDVPALGGKVRVQGLLLSARLSIFDDAEVRGKGFWHIARLLSATVVDADGDPIFSEAEWEMFGGEHLDEAMVLYAVCRRLNGMDSAGAKKN